MTSPNDAAASAAPVEAVTWPREPASKRERRAKQARIDLLTDEADKQRDIAAGRLATTTTKASLLLVGAGLIAGGWLVELIARPFGALPLATMLFALASAACALIALVPRSNLKLNLTKVSIDALSPRADAPSPLALSDKILAAKLATLDAINDDDKRRDGVVRVGYVLLAIALLGGAVTVIAAMIVPAAAPSPLPSPAALTVLSLPG